MLYTFCNTRYGTCYAYQNMAIYWCVVLILTYGKSSVKKQHLAQTVHRHIVTGTAVSQTSWLQQNLPWCRTRPQTVPSVNKWQILKGLEAKWGQIISSTGVHTLTHALIAHYDWSWRINCTFLFIKSSNSSSQKCLPIHTKFTPYNTQQ